VQTPLYKIIDILEKLIDQPKEDTQAAMDEFKADLRSKVELVENALESVLAGQKAKKLVKKGE
jgi:molecular chaperone GrpE (heat shock protein)